MSLCKTRNLDEDDEHREGQIKDIVKLKDSSNEKIHENKKEKKKKISIPKDSIFKEDEELIKKNEQKIEKKVEIINTDIPKELNDNNEEKLEYNADSTNEIIKEEQNRIKNANNEEKNEIKNEEIKKEEDNINSIQNEKVENEIKNTEENIIKNKDNDILEEIDNNKKDKIINNIKEEEIKNENIVKGEHIEKEEEIAIETDIQMNEKHKVEIKDEEENNNTKRNEKDDKEIINKVEEEKVELENKNDIKEENNNIENIEKKENSIAQTLKNILNKVEEQSEKKEEFEKEKEEEESKGKINEIIEEKKEPEQEQKQEKDNNQNEELKEDKQEKEPEKMNDISLNDFLTKNDSLIKAVNITLESKGYSKSDIKTKINDFFEKITETKLDESHVESISNLLIQLLSTTLESDKKDLDKFFKELFSVFEYNKEKIHEQLINFSNDIEEQEKLKTRKTNRSIRSNIKDCQDKLNPIFKRDDMPSDRVVSFDKFNQIAEEVGLNLKKEYLDVLLYQMKMAVPKGRSIHDFNMIVIVDFLK